MTKITIPSVFAASCARIVHVRPALTFPDTLSGSVDVALANAHGVNLRYEVRRVARGRWRAEVEADGRTYRPSEFYATRTAARAFCRRDFNRRLILKVAA